MRTLPTYFVPMGHPHSGKSEVQRILRDRHGVEPVDDGRALRDACKIFFGLSEWQVTTQEGKASWVMVNGRGYQVRDLLGTIGELLENQWGAEIVSEMALRSANERYSTHIAEGGSICFSSVRREQGLHYRRLAPSETFVFVVERPGIEPSPFAFDRFDVSVAHYILHNDGTVADLEVKIETMLAAARKSYLGGWLVAA